MDLLKVDYPASLRHSDPMLLFTSMMVHTVVLCLCTIMESVRCETRDYQKAAAAFRQRSLLVARDMVALSRSLAQLSCLKVGVPLFLGTLRDF